MSWTIPTNHIDINARVTKDSAWHDVDLGTNDDVPSGTKAVILHFRQIGTTSAAFSRPNGSSDAKNLYVMQGYHNHQLVMLDSNRIFEAKVSPNCDVKIVAYSDDDYYFAPVDKSTGTTGSYQDVDVSGDGVSAGAAAVWLELRHDASLTFPAIAVRKNGISYDKYYDLAYYNCISLGFAGLDENRVFEQKIESTRADCWLLGYCDIYVEPLDVPIEKTISNTNQWTDVDLDSGTPDGIIGVIVHVINTGSSEYLANLRKKGSVDNEVTNCYVRRNQFLHMVVGVDENAVFQAYTNSPTKIKFNIIGYIFESPTVRINEAVSITASDNITANQALINEAVSFTIAEQFGQADDHRMMLTF